MANSNSQIRRLELMRGVFKDFRRSIKDIIPTADIKYLNSKEMLEFSVNNEESLQLRKRLIHQEGDDYFYVILHAPSPAIIPHAVFRISIGYLDELDLMVVRSYVRVFNQDLERCPDILRDESLWGVLRSTQFLRTMAVCSKVNSSNALLWLQTMENSVALTYEGNPAHHTVFMAHKKDSALERLNGAVIPLKHSIPLERALLSEKWIRSVVDGTHICLLATGKGRGHAAGLITIEALEHPTPQGVSPHHILAKLRQYLDTREMLMAASPAGDLFILQSSGAVFQKSQGKWRYINYNHVLVPLCEELDEQLSIAVLQMAVDLAFERKGALLCITESLSTASLMVSDHRSSRRANKTLRIAIRGLKLTDPIHRPIISAAASTDGAIVLDYSGTVLDAACMIQRPTPEIIESFGFTEPRSFSGARSTAAWNASFSGIVVKVSEDGPISAWRNGHQLVEIG